MHPISRKIARMVKFKKHRYIVYMADSLQQLVKPHSDIPFCIEYFDAASLAAFFQNSQPGRYRLFKGFLDRHYLGIYFKNCDRILAYGWGMTYVGGGTFHSNNHLPLTNRQGHIFYCYTENDFRGHHLYSCLIYQLAADIFAAGAERLWIDTNDDNIPAQKGILRVGFQPFGVMTNMFLFRRRIYSKISKN